MTAPLWLGGSDLAFLLAGCVRSLPLDCNQEYASKPDLVKLTPVPSIMVNSMTTDLAPEPMPHLNFGAT